MTTTWGKGRATKVPYTAIQERHRRTGWGEGRTAHDRGIKQHEYTEHTRGGVGQLAPENTRHSHLLDLASHGPANARGKK